MAVRTSRRLPADPATVLVLLRESSRWPEWQPEILETRGPAAVAPGDVVEGTASMLGFRVAGVARVTSVEPSALEHDVVVGVRMRVRYEVAEVPGGVVLTHVLAADLPGGLVGRLLSILLRPRLRWMQERVLGSLSRTVARHRSEEGDGQAPHHDVGRPADGEPAGPARGRPRAGLRAPGDDGAHER